MIPDGPFFDDLEPGQRLDPSPAITVGPGEVAMYQAICGDPLALVLSRPLAEAVTGEPGQLVDPGLVMHVAIGQSTVATRRVIANLFYRGVRLARTVRVGDTLSTRVTIGPMRESTRRPDRPPRGLAVLRIRTVDQDEQVVVDFERCAMLPLRDDADTGHAGDVGSAETDLDLSGYAAFAPTGWDLEPLGPPEAWPVGEGRADPMRDTVSGALELVRLTQNQAIAHRDPALGQGGRRLVYGGHTIGLAQASLGRQLRSLATVVGWHSCDHLAPVFEGDVLSFRSELVDAVALDSGRLLAFAVTVDAHRDGSEPTPVLDWRPVVFAP